MLQVRHCRKAAPRKHRSRVLDILDVHPGSSVGDGDCPLVESATLVHDRPELPTKALQFPRNVSGRKQRLLCPAQSKAEGTIAFRPCIDIHKGKVKQIVGSSLQDLAQVGSSNLQPIQPITNFESSFPARFYAKLYQQCNLPGGHVILLGADFQSRCSAIEALLTYPGGMHLGGGVTPDNAFAYLDAGASHVIVTSYVFRDGHLDSDRLKAMVAAVGKERLVLDLSCRKRDGHYWVVTDRWQRFSDLAVDAPSLEALAGSCSEFLVHGVDVEGKKLGIDVELVQLLGKSCPLPVTYAGGATTMEDLKLVQAAGQGRVDITVGSALDIFGGQLPFKDVVAWHRGQMGLPNTASGR